MYLGEIVSACEGCETAKTRFELVMLGNVESYHYIDRGLQKTYNTALE